MMLTPQINRLNRDYNEIGFHIQRLKKQGKHEMIHILQKKQQLIELTIEDLRAELMERSCQ